MREITDVSCYLVVSCVHRGTTGSVLNVLKQVQKYYNAKVLHLGKIATDDEIAMHARRENKILTWEKIAKEKITETQEENLKAAKKENAKLEAAQERRVNLLKETFGKDTEFIINETQYLPSKTKMDECLTEKALCQYLKVSSVSANGERLSFSPITPKSFAYFRRRESSFIVPHPTPVLRSFNKPGLNQAYVLATTGSLRISPEVNRPSDQHYVANMPSAMLVIIDNETGEFHQKRLHFDFFETGITRVTFIADDGMVFLAKETIEVGSEDKAAYVTDEHSAFEHRGVVAASLALVDLHQPETFINGGDVCDMISVCHHNEGKPGLQENNRLIDDLRSMKRLMDAQTSNPCIKHKVLIDSNHMKWLTDFVMKNPQLIGLLDLQSVHDLYYRDWRFIDPLKNEIYKWGDLVVRHGHQLGEGTLTQAASIFVKYLKGHVHSHNEYLRAASAGPGCGLGPSYVGGAVTSWTNCITSLTKWRGITSFNIKTVLHSDDRKVSRFAYRNKIIEVSWHVYKTE